MLEALLLVLGFALLIKGSDIFVDASVGIAKKLRIPSVIIGLTVVAIGTSFPELVISVTASVRGANALAISNIVGSNIVNLLMGVGLCAMTKQLFFKTNEIAKDFWISIIAAVALLGLMIFSGDAIPRFGGAVLAAIFIAYMVMLTRQAIKNRPPEETGGTQRRISIIILLAVLGLGMIFAGGQLTVVNAVKIAAAIGITERVIGLTIVAVGTSLPELVIFAISCKRGENDLAIGTIIGSNIFNILFVLGIAGLVSPLAIDKALIIDTSVLIFGSLLALLFIYTGKRLARREGFIMVLMYAGYMVYVFM